MKKQRGRGKDLNAKQAPVAGVGVQLAFATPFLLWLGASLADQGRRRAERVAACRGIAGVERRVNTRRVALSPARAAGPGRAGRRSFSARSRDNTAAATVPVSTTSARFGVGIHVVYNRSPCPYSSLTRIVAGTKSTRPGLSVHDA